jgi:flavin-dependent dehydrogenase
MNDQEDIEKINTGHQDLPLYDVAIIGGGLAGLSLSILLAKKSYKVILFEKEKYPFHKVCGEYISLESWDFIERLGLQLSQMNLPIIKKLIVTSPAGQKIESDLSPGGFGISRYLLDNSLSKIARENGVQIFEEVKITNLEFAHDKFTISASGKNVQSKVAVGSFGKRSNLDVKWKRLFVKKKPGKLNNYIGVKYHVQSTFPTDTISLHKFKNGYCGISRIEQNKYCLCYLTTARNLSTNNNSVSLMEKNVLHKNPYLKQLFENSNILFDSPVVISQISFDKKSQVEDHVLMVGDAAGMIAPLCGNGMSMAFQGAKIAAEHINNYLQNKVPRKSMEKYYTHGWNSHFNTRLLVGRTIQSFFGKDWITNLFIRTLQIFPAVTRYLISLTHGKTF